MDPVAALTDWGGVSARGPLVAKCGRQVVDRALREGSIVRLHRDRYALPTADAAVAAAHSLSGVLGLTSAALYHGWAVARAPKLPHVVVARGRRMELERTRSVDIRWATLGRGDVVDGICTSKERTLTDCLRFLPFDEALAVADSALRAGDLSTVRRVGALASGPRAPQIRRAAACARADAANPFESRLRAIALGVPGLNVEPQVLITSVNPWARVDLADRDLRIVLEADSFEWHGHRAALLADAQRYNRLVAGGWTVLRFAWEEVMLRPELVRETLVAVVQRHTKVPRKRRCAA